ncbi:MAG: phosphonate C-P lyase system protein PhnH [Pseudomonadota bacterium]
MLAESMEGGFQDAPIDAALAFRAALDAMSRPGKVHTVAGAAGPAPLSVAASCLALTLCDPDTPVWLAPTLSDRAVADWFRFHTGAPLSDRASVRFAFGCWDEMLPLHDFPIGTPDYPDRAATLIVEVAAFGDANRLTGPGIRDDARLTVPDPAAFRANAALFPQGLDFFLTCGDRVAGVPRTTCVEA